MKPEMRVAFKRSEFNAVLDIQCAERIAEAVAAASAHLRATLEWTCRRYDPDDRLPCWCYASVPLEQLRVHEDKCLRIRSALSKVSIQ